MLRSLYNICNTKVAMNGWPAAAAADYMVRARALGSRVGARRRSERLRGRYSPIAVSTLSLHDAAGAAVEGASREQALAANSGNVWQTSRAEIAVISGFGNVWQRVEKTPPDFASRRSPVRSRLAPSKRPGNGRFIDMEQVVGVRKRQASACFPVRHIAAWRAEFLGVRQSLFARRLVFSVAPGRSDELPSRVACRVP
jgi:hypothetical protein